MSDWVEIDGSLINTAKVSSIIHNGTCVYINGISDNIVKIDLDCYVKAKELYGKLRAQLIPQTEIIHNNYGPDNASTPDDITETNELKSLRRAVEEIGNIVCEDYSKGKTIWIQEMFIQLDRIQKLVKPFC